MDEVVDLEYIQRTHWDIWKTETDRAIEGKKQSTAFKTKDQTSTRETYKEVDDSLLSRSDSGIDETLRTK